MYIICTELLVIAMVNPDMPRATISFTRCFFSRNAEVLSLKIALLPVKNFTIQTAESSWERIVASAAPCTPMCKVKIKMGSRIILAIAPSSTVIIPIVPKPCELMKLFIPRPIITKILPRR